MNAIAAAFYLMMSFINPRDWPPREKFDDGPVKTRIVSHQPNAQVHGQRRFEP